MADGGKTKGLSWSSNSWPGGSFVMFRPAPRPPRIKRGDRWPKGTRGLLNPELSSRLQLQVVVGNCLNLAGGLSATSEQASPLLGAFNKFMVLFSCVSEVPVQGEGVGCENLRIAC